MNLSHFKDPLSQGYSTGGLNSGPKRNDIWTDTFAPRTYLLALYCKAFTTIIMLPANSINGLCHGFWSVSLCSANKQTSNDHVQSTAC